MKSLLFLLLFVISQSIMGMEGCNPLPDSDSLLTHCKMSVGNYPRPVHFFIPSSLNYTHPLKVIVHFHGHNLAGYDHFYRTKVKGEGFGDYGAFLLASKANGIVIVPESLGNCSTYDTFFADEKRAADFFLALEKLILGTESSDSFPLILSAHSGAYRVLNRLAGLANREVAPLNQIKSIGLFDATYGPVPNIVKWVKNKSDKNEDFVFYDSYVTGFNATAENGSLALLKELKPLDTNNIFFFPLPGKKSEVLLKQHFSVLRLGSLSKFWQIP